MTKTQLINEAYAAIDKEDYVTAERKLLRCLETRDGFNIRYGLAVCNFNKFLGSNQESELDLAIQHSKEAVDIFDSHFDAHFILAQCYATKYFLTDDGNFRHQAVVEYGISRELVSQRPGMDAQVLEDRITELELKLFDPKWN